MPVVVDQPVSKKLVVPIVASAVDQSVIAESQQRAHERWTPVLTAAKHVHV